MRCRCRRVSGLLFLRSLAAAVAVWGIINILNAFTDVGRSLAIDSQPPLEDRSGTKDGTKTIMTGNKTTRGSKTDGGKRAKGGNKTGEGNKTTGGNKTKKKQTWPPKRRSGWQAAITSMTARAIWGAPPGPRASEEGPSDVRLMYVGILSAPINFHQRFRMRAAYFSKMRRTFRSSGEVWGEFVVGHVQPRDRLELTGDPCQVAVERALMEESLLHGDVYRVAMPEKYSRISDKSFAILKRGVDLGYQFIVKTDDDFVLDWTTLLNRFRTWDAMDFIYGGNYYWAKKSYDIQVPKMGEFVEYFNGRGYFVSWSLGWEIVRTHASESAAYLPYGASSEDINTGIWVKMVEDATARKVYIAKVPFNYELESREPADHTLRLVARPDVCISMEGTTFASNLAVAAPCFKKGIAPPQIHMNMKGTIKLNLTAFNLNVSRKRREHAVCLGSAKLRKLGNRLQFKPCILTPLSFVRCSDGTVRQSQRESQCLTVTEVELGDGTEVTLQECSPKLGHLQQFAWRSIQEVTKTELSARKKELTSRFGSAAPGTCPVNLTNGSASRLRIWHRPGPGLPPLVECASPQERPLENARLVDTVPGGGRSPRQLPQDRLLYIGVLSGQSHMSYMTGRAKVRALNISAAHPGVRVEFLIGNDDFDGNKQGSLAKDRQVAIEKTLQREQLMHGDIYRVPVFDGLVTAVDKALLVLEHGVDEGYGFIMVVPSEDLAAVLALNVVKALADLRMRKPARAMYAGMGDRLPARVAPRASPNSTASVSGGALGFAHVRIGEPWRFNRSVHVFSWELARRVAKVNVPFSAAFVGYGNAKVEDTIPLWVARAAALDPGGVDYVDRWPHGTVARALASYALARRLLGAAFLSLHVACQPSARPD